jgi:ankyrin repeat protein
MDVNPLDNASDNVVPDATYTPVGISKDRHHHHRLNPTSLHAACEKGSVEDVQLLLDQGADINGRDANHDPALHVALWNRRLEVAEVLIKYGADVNCREKTGWTPLMAASQLGYRDIAELLLDHGADVNAKKEDHWTALHLVSSHDHLEIVKMLIDRGADIHARNIDGHTPSGIASRTGGRDIIDYFSGVKDKSPGVCAFSTPFLLFPILMPFLSIVTSRQE